MRPVLFKLADNLIYSYPLFLGLSFGFAYYYSVGLLEKNKISTEGFKFLFFGICIFSWLGAKIFFLIHTPTFSSTHYLASSFWLGGGFVFYGGLIFATLFALIYCLIFKKFSLKSLALLLPALPMAHAIGRVGCFLAGCCYGQETMWITAININGLHRHPVQIYEAVGNTIIFFIIRKFQKINLFISVIIYFVSYSFLRFILEFVRADVERGIYNGLSSAQWTSFLIIFLGLLAYFLFYPKKTNQ